LLAPPAPREPAEPPIEVVTGPRVGVSGEGGSVRFPWRFSVAGHRSVSAFRRGRNVPD
ncbi:3-methyladenine DNA glycosylase, partial [Micrococcus luteus]|nr:3-methyladenine DNA glycosylase [Micrococcus luteus]